MHCLGWIEGKNMQLLNGKENANVFRSFFVALETKALLFSKTFRKAGMENFIIKTVLYDKKLGNTVKTQ